MKIGTFTIRRDKTGHCAPKSSAAPVDSSRTNNIVCLCHKHARSAERQRFDETFQHGVNDIHDTFVPPAYISTAYISDARYQRKHIETLSPPDVRQGNPRRPIIEPNDYPDTKLFYRDLAAVLLSLTALTVFATLASLAVLEWILK